MYKIFVSVFVRFGQAPDACWQARNALGWGLLEKAARVAPNDAAREAIVVGSANHMLDLYEMDSPLREQVWQAVEQAARDASREAPGPSPLWSRDWIDHVADLVREMEARRLGPNGPRA